MRRAIAKTIVTVRKSYFAAFVYIVTFIVILPLALHDKVYSPYFSYEDNDPMFLDTLNRQNIKRLTKSKEYLNQVGDGTKRPANVGNPKLDIALIASESPLLSNTGAIDDKGKTMFGSPDHLIQSSTYLHKLIMEDSNFGVNNVMICDISPKPSTNESTNLRPASKLFKTVYRYSSDSEGSSLLEPNQKNVADYGFCLKQTVTNQSDYTLMLQYDILPRESFFKSLRWATRRLQNRFVRGEREGIVLGEIELYHPPKLSGFIYGDGTHLMELGFLGVIGAMMTYILRWLMRIRVSRSKSCFLGGLYCMLVCVGIGRPYVIAVLASRLDYYRLMRADACHVNAVLYPSSIARDLTTFITQNLSGANVQVEQAVKSFMDSRGMESFLMVPNLVSNIGYMSSADSESLKLAQFVSDV